MMVHRWTSTGALQWVRTFTVSLPRTIAEMPWRPCEAMAIRSQPPRPRSIDDRYSSARIPILRRPLLSKDANAQRSKHIRRIAECANKDPILQTMVCNRPRSLTRSIWRCFDLHGTYKVQVTNIADDTTGAPDVVNGYFPFAGDARDFFKDASA